MAAALILSVLGVPRATVVADYGLTGVYLPGTEIKRMIAEEGSKMGMSPEDIRTHQNYPPEVLDLMYRTDPVFMKVALQRIDEQFGGPVALAKKLYGLDDRKISILRRRYLI